MAGIYVECLPVGAFQENCYLVVNAETRECLIVDPGAEGERIIRAAQEYKPAAVLLTHAHWDHIGAVDAVCGHFGIPLYVHEADAPKLTDSTKNVARQFGCDVTVATRPHLLHGGETLFLADMELRVLHTPGHSAGSVCYLLPQGQGVLTGDTLFAHGYGRTDFADGSFHELKESLRALFHLSPRQVAYPGHEEAGTVGHEHGKGAHRAVYAASGIRQRPVRRAQAVFSGGSL